MVSIESFSDVRQADREFSSLFWFVERHHCRLLSRFAQGERPTLEIFNYLCSPSNYAEEIDRLFNCMVSIEVQKRRIFFEEN